MNISHDELNKLYVAARAGNLSTIKEKISFNTPSWVLSNIYFHGTFCIDDQVENFFSMLYFIFQCNSRYTMISNENSELNNACKELDVKKVRGLLQSGQLHKIEADDAVHTLWNTWRLNENKEHELIMKIRNLLFDYSFYGELQLYPGDELLVGDVECVNRALKCKTDLNIYPF